MVLRVQVTANGNLTVRRGPMFRVHERGGRTTQDSERIQMSATSRIDQDGRLQFSGANDAEHVIDLVEFSATLTKEGAFFRGTLVETTCHRQTQQEVTCWDQREVVGSGWGHNATSPFPAKFDGQTGRCLDDDGNDALNDIPIEFIRETGNGECADLRGVRLNGDDFGYPELRHWRLQGARLDGADLSFANLDGVVLWGAQMGDMNLGYATIHGYHNEFTQLPAEANCDVTTRQGQVTCIR
jgi:hypothetical protein